VLEALHMGKVLVVVPNATLMDNHQAEVAKALSDEGYLLQSTPKYPSLLLRLTPVIWRKRLQG
jgi:beta-1,4-N-acetylglucosaminyltransferase